MKALLFALLAIDTAWFAWSGATSKALDAGLHAHFGQLSWTASGSLELSTRSGNTQQPDDTWSPWSEPLIKPGMIQSPPARYVQIRARWSRDPQAALQRA